MLKALGYAERIRTVNLDEIKGGLRDRAEELATYLFPLGKRNGHEWTIGDVAGNPSRKPTGIGSLGICVDGLKKGAWRDHATDEKGTLLDLWAMRFGYHGTDGWVTKAGEECASWLGGTFEKRGAEPRIETPPRNATQQLQTPPTRPIQQGNNVARHQAHAPVKHHPKLPPYTAEWDAAVEQMTDEVAVSLAKSRGYSRPFVQWLKERKLVGVVKRGGCGDALALPVHDEKGIVIAAQVRNRTKGADGKLIEPPQPKWQYLYHGETSPGTRLLIIGDVKKATKLWVFESQWDAFAVIDRLGLHTAPEWPHIAILITRGASNARLLQPHIGEGKTLILWPQNDLTNENGKKPAEDWVKAILEIAAGAMPVRRVNTPKEYEDPNAWLKACPLADGDADSDTTAMAVTPAKLNAAISQALPAMPNDLPPLRDMAFAIRPENRLSFPSEVIKGILHRGSKMVIGGTSKGRKSFSLIDLAVSVATGRKWWGFDCVPGRVLYLNFEIQTPFFDGRVASIAEAKIAELSEGNLLSITLRGSVKTIEKLAQELIDFILNLDPFAVIIFDPIYKLMAGKDENKAGDVGLIMAQLERVAVETGAAIIFGAHYSKGNQAEKESIDRIGGSGVFARDPDAILTMTPHQEADSFTVEATLRNYAPVDPFVVSWSHPLFERNDALDPADLKLPKRYGANGKGGAASPSAPKLRTNARLPRALDMMQTVFKGFPRCHKWTEMMRAAMAQCTGPKGKPMKEDMAKDYLKVLERELYIKKDELTGRWITTEKGDEYLDDLAPPESASVGGMAHGEPLQ